MKEEYNALILTRGHGGIGRRGLRAMNSQLIVDGNLHYTQGQIEKERRERRHLQDSLS